MQKFIYIVVFFLSENRHFLLSSIPASSDKLYKPSAKCWRFFYWFERVRLSFRLRKDVLAGGTTWKSHVRSQRIRCVCTMYNTAFGNSPAWSSQSFPDRNASPLACSRSLRCWLHFFTSDSRFQLCSRQAMAGRRSLLPCHVHTSPR